MFETLAGEKLEDYNRNSVRDWAEALVIDSHSNIQSYLESLEDRTQYLSVRSDVPKHYENDHHQLIKETASVSNHRVFTVIRN